MRSEVLTEEEGENVNVVSIEMTSLVAIRVGVGVIVNSGREVVSDAKTLLVLREKEGLDMMVVADGMTVSLDIKNSPLVGVGVGVRISAGKELVSDARKEGMGVIVMISGLDVGTNTGSEVVSTAVAEKEGVGVNVTLGDAVWTWLVLIKLEVGSSTELEANTVSS